MSILAERSTRSSHNTQTADSLGSSGIGNSLPGPARGAEIGTVPPGITLGVSGVVVVALGLWVFVGQTVMTGLAGINSALGGV